MTTNEAIATLETNRHRNADFHSDPINGDTIHVFDGGAEAVSDLLDRLDFEAYEGNGPIVTVVDEHDPFS